MLKQASKLAVVLMVSLSLLATVACSKSTSGEKEGDKTSSEKTPAAKEKEAESQPAK